MEVDSDAMSEDSGITVGRNSFLNPNELSLDVKIAFARVAYLINIMEQSEEVYGILKKIQSSIVKYLIHKKDQLKNEAETTSNSLALQPVVPHMAPAQTFTEKVFHESLRTDQRSLDRSRMIHLNFTHNSSFQPIPARNGKIGLNGNGNGYGYGKLRDLDITSIAESVIIEEDDEFDSGNASSPESPGADSVFLLKKWSVKKDDDKLYLTGIKLDRKGNLLEKDFLSKKVVSRTQNHTVKTQCGEYKLDEPVSDPKKCIPTEIKEVFLKEPTHFPKNWKKLLGIWIDIEKKSSKQKRKSDPKPKNQKRKSDPKPETNGTSGKVRKSSEGDLNKSKMKKPSTPEEKDMPPAKKNVPGKKASPDENKKDKESPENNFAPLKKKEEQKTQKKKAENNKATKQQEKKKKEPKQALKREKKADKPTSKRAENAKKKKLDDILGNETAPFVNELADLGGNVIEMPSTSLTPNGLMASIRRESITGRWTPPTKDFDNIYGKVTPASTSSALEDSFDIASKATNVVKRMAKAKSAPKTDYKVAQKPALSKIDEKQNELVDHLLQSALTAKPTRTPELVKKVFRSQEKYDEGESDGYEDEM